MSPIARERLFGFSSAFDSSATVVLLSVIGAALLVAPLLILLACRLGKLDADRCSELWRLYRAWLYLAPALVVPILLGAFWAILGVALLGVLCYREYARGTGLFREKLVSLVTVVCILAIHFAVLDNWYRLFVVLFPLAVVAVAALAVVQDRPKGFIQRVALGIFGFALCGGCLAHLGYLANDTNYRPLLLLVLVAVALNDIAAFVAGRTLGGPRLCPNTSPNKTVAGALGALVATTLLVVLVGPLVFAGTALEERGLLTILGLLVSATAQFGDLTLSAIKRDLGVGGMGTLIPGHGGLLDRFDSLILASPAAFHFIHYFVGVGTGQPACVFTGAR